jgi:hypothetical protein
MQSHLLLSFNYVYCGKFKYAFGSKFLKNIVNHNNNTELKSIIV